jgi:hypothetical protein
MSTVSQLAPVHDIDWEAVGAFATQEIIQCLQSDELFMSAQHMRDRACRVLRFEHRLVVPDSTTAKVHGIAKDTGCWHCRQYRVNATCPVSNGGQPIPWHAERDDGHLDRESPVLCLDLPSSYDSFGHTICFCAWMAAAISRCHICG